MTTEAQLLPAEDVSVAKEASLRAYGWSSFKPYTEGPPPSMERKKSMSDDDQFINVVGDDVTGAGRTFAESALGTALRCQKGGNQSPGNHRDSVLSSYDPA